MTIVLMQSISIVDSDSHAMYAYLQLIGVSVTKKGLATLVCEHSDTGTLLSVSKVLTGLGVENGVAKASAEQLVTPFIARMKFGDGLSLTVVKRFDDDAVVYLLPAAGFTPSDQRWVTTDRPKFSDEFDYIVLIGEADSGAGQANYASARAVENRKHNSTLAVLAVPPALAILAVATAFTQRGFASRVILPDHHVNWFDCEVG